DRPDERAFLVEEREARRHHARYQDRVAGKAPDPSHEPELAGAVPFPADAAQVPPIGGEVAELVRAAVRDHDAPVRETDRSRNPVELVRRIAIEHADLDLRLGGDAPCLARPP